MLSLAHTIISLPVGVYLQNPWLIFIAAFVLHLLMDTFKHWNIYPWQFKKYPYALVALDITAGLAAAWFLLNDQTLTLPILAAIAGGNAPDVLHGVWEFTAQKTKNSYFSRAKPFFIFHDRIQRETTHIGTGLIWQGIFMAVSIFLVLSY